MKITLPLVVAGAAIGYVWWQSKQAATAAAQVPAMLAQQVALAQGAVTDISAPTTPYLSYGPIDPNDPDNLSTTAAPAAAQFPGRFFQ